MKTIFYLSIFIFLFLGCNESPENQKTDRATTISKEKFKWDFNSGKIYSYSFEQITNSINYWGGVSEDIDTSEITGNGVLNIKSKGNNKADFVLTDLKIKSDISINLDGEKDSTPGQTMVLQNMDANGTFEPRKSNSEIMFDLTFPLPSHDLKPGEKEKLILEVPFNLMGSPLYVKGFNELKYLKDVKNGKTNNAILRSKIKVDQLDIPEEIKGEFECSFTGEAEYEFNYEKKYFISATIDLNIVMKSTYDSGENEMGKINMDMRSNNKYKIKFIEIKKD